MKKIIFALLIFFFALSVFSQQDTTNYKLNPNTFDNKYDKMLNKTSLFGKAGSSISMRLIFAVTPGMDTTDWNISNWTFDGKYEKVWNKNNFFGKPLKNVTAELVYLVNDIPTIDSNRIPFLSKSNTFTGALNIFQNIQVSNGIFDTITTDVITTAESFKVRYNDTTYAEFDAVRDTFWMPKLYIGNLSSNTHINNTSVTTNSLNANIINSDTIHPSSPLILDADSTIAGNVYGNIFKGDSVVSTYATIDTTKSNYFSSVMGTGSMSITGSSISLTNTNGNASIGIIFRSATSTTPYWVVGNQSNFVGANNFAISCNATLSTLFSSTGDIWTGLSSGDLGKPLFPFDSLFVKNGVFSRGLSVDSFTTTSVLGHLNPTTNYGYNLGLYNQRWDTVNTNYVKSNTDKTTSLIARYIFGTSGLLAFENSFYPDGVKTFDMGAVGASWRNTYTASITLGIDSIGASTSDTIKAGKNTMIVNCDAVNNDTVYLANIGVSDGFEFSVIKVDAQATYVVVVPKGGYTIGDFAASDSFTGKTGRTYILKNKNFYIKP